MPLQPAGQAPYTSVAAAITAIEIFRDRGFSPITTDALIRAGVPESLARRTIQSLRLLDLITDDGKPTPQFEAFRQARGEEEFQARMQEWIRGAYADVLQYVDPSTDSYDRVVEAFRTFEPQGQRRSMATLLIGLWRRAGLTTEAIGIGGLPSEESPRVARPRAQSKNSSAPRRSASLTKPAPRLQFQQTADISDLPPGLVGLLRQIPREGKTWTEETRAAFLGAFTAVLNFTVPVGEPVVQDDEIENDGEH
jgi:hypothetical protein